jgi:hypothetical protein
MNLEDEIDQIHQLTPEIDNILYLSAKDPKNRFQEPIFIVSFRYKTMEWGLYVHPMSMHAIEHFREQAKSAFQKQLLTMKYL